MDRTTTSDGAALQRLRLLAALLAALALVAVGCGGSGEQKTTKPRGPTPAQLAAHRRQLALGAQVFAKHCGNCHTIAGKVAHPSFIESPIPNLDEVKPKAPYIRQRVETGGFDMPSLQGELSAAERSAVIAYVAEISGRNVAAGASTADQALGEQVFLGHCQRCHAIAGRAATGSPNYPGTNFNDVRPSVKLIMNQVRRGINEEMPSFRGTLTAAQIEAVAHYVNAAAGR
jgi:cbb3-type cytochrome c oxidase subunit III